MVPHWGKLTEIVKRGPPTHKINLGKDGSEFFLRFVENLFPIHRSGAESLADALGVADAQRPVPVLDLAAGSGVWRFLQIDLVRRPTAFHDFGELSPMRHHRLAGHQQKRPMKGGFVPDEKDGTFGCQLEQLLVVLVEQLQTNQCVQQRPQPARRGSGSCLEFLDIQSAAGRADRIRPGEALFRSPGAVRIPRQIASDDRE